MSILFYGDAHGVWRPLHRAVRKHRPDAIILLGDLGLEAPFTHTLAEEIELGIPIRWIAGNHDTASLEAYDWLWTDGAAYGPLTAPECLGGWSVAGLGGVFKSRVWYPQQTGLEEGSIRTRDEWVAKHRHSTPLFRGGLPLNLRDTIFPQDYDALEKRFCNILACHEAPQAFSAIKGFPAIDEVAATMQASLIVHSHHHKSGWHKTFDGTAVRSLGKAEPYLCDH